MKKYFYLFLVVVMGFVLSSCEEDSDNPIGGDGTQGSVFVQSEPIGASIYVDNGTTSKGTTPDTVQNLTTGNHTITLKLDGYADTTFTVNIREDMMTTPAVVTMRSSLTVQKFTARIYETAGTGANQPSGLDLSTGEAVSISTDPDADIYYGSVDFTIRSANLFNSSKRATDILEGAFGDNLEDGVDSPLATNSWDNNVGDREDSYFFLFDEDLHYSKMIITDFHTGSGTTDPSWVEVEWYYNTTANNRGF